MAELFNDESCVRWWLPGEQGFSRILKSLRAFADERNAMATSAQSESVREVRQIFAKVSLGHSNQTTPEIEMEDEQSTLPTAL
jgi:hypothetical protein